MKVQDAIRLVDGRTASFATNAEYEQTGVGFNQDENAQRSYLLGMDLDDPDLLWRACGATAHALFMLLARSRFNPVLTIRSSLMQMVLLGYVLGDAAGYERGKAEREE